MEFFGIINQKLKDNQLFRALFVYCYNLLTSLIFPYNDPSERRVGRSENPPFHSAKQLEPNKINSSNLAFLPSCQAKSVVKGVRLKLNLYGITR